MTDPLLAHAISVVCLVARFAPVVFLCPLLGGLAAPTTVRLTLALSLALSAHAGGADVPTELHGLSMARVALGEALIGTVMGLVVRGPFLAAEMTGLLSDLARGASGETALPGIGSKEASLGVMLQHTLLAALTVGVGTPLLLRGLWQSLNDFPLGGPTIGAATWLNVGTTLGSALATGVGLAVPVVVSCWAVDATVATAARALPGFALVENSAGLRLATGAVVMVLVHSLCVSSLREDFVAAALRVAGTAAGSP